MSNVKKILWIADGLCPSGFGRATHEILDIVTQKHDVTLMAMNYRGDPPIDPKTGFFYRYLCYSAGAAGPDGRYDSLGVSRLHWMCNRVKPDLIVLQNDGWFVPLYMRELRRRKPTGEYEFPEHAAIPVIAAVAVDGKNFQGRWIKDLTQTVFWTDFALKEARAGGHVGASKVIPLGVDTEVYYPVERRGALERKCAMGLEGQFVVGNVNRNQPRKRWDLLIQYFAKWIHSKNVSDARLYFHSAPTGDESFNLVQLAEHYGILDRLAWCQPEAFYGQSEDEMRDTYNCFDVYATTTQGEGFGLTTLEAMACRVPCIVPEWSALGDWAKGAAVMVPCTTTNLQSPGLTVIGGVADERLFIEALDLLYRDKERRAEVGRLGFERAQLPYFRWRNIGDEWVKTIDEMFAEREAIDQRPTGEVWQDLKAVEALQKEQAEQQEAGQEPGRAGRAELPGKAVAGEEKPALARPDRQDQSSPSDQPEALAGSGREA